MPGFERAKKRVYIYGDTPPINIDSLVREILMMRDSDKFWFNVINCNGTAGGNRKIAKVYREIAAAGGRYEDIWHKDEETDRTD